MTAPSPRPPGQDVDWGLVGPWPIETPTGSDEWQGDLAEMFGPELEVGVNDGQALAYRLIFWELRGGNFDDIASEFSLEEARATLARYQVHSVITDTWMDAVGLAHPSENDTNKKWTSALRRRVAKLERPRPVFQTHESLIHKVKAALDIESFASRFTQLRSAGRARMKGKCPLHGGGNERTPSFYVYTTEQRWHCFGGCGGKGGDIIDLASALREIGRW